MTAFADFRFAPGEDLADLGGPASRFNHNVVAIKLLKSLEAESRAPGRLTPAEQQTLVRYSGWGDSEVLDRLFPDGAYRQAPIHPSLAGILTEEEREQMASSALNAHYTAIPIIRAIYDALDHLGIGALPALRVLEPAAGIGHFFGAMPEAVAAKAERVAVELDSITARILAFLYPNAKVFQQGFEETALPNDYFDLAISNAPFGNYAVHDPRIKERHLKAAIHDYYFARSLRLVKPGGIIAFITSRYTLDKVNPRVRRHIAEHAELLAAARLPESAFRKNAGTEVVTDVLILRRKTTPGGIDNKLVWIETDALANAEEYRVPVNRLYIEHPELMLGVPGCSRGMYGDHEFTLKPDGRDLAAALRDSLISQLPSQAFAATAANQSTAAPLPVEDAREKEKAGAVDLDRLSGISRQRDSLLLDLYSAAKQVIKLQLLDAEDEKLAEAQRELNSLYLRFTARYGPINAKQNLKDLDRRSPLVPFLRALEEPAGKGSWKRAAIFRSRTIRPRKGFAQISSPKDALFFCLNETERVDLDRIAAMTGQSKEEAAGVLRGLIFETTSGGWVTADEYLSGNVVEKLKEAQAAAALNPRFQENVEALTAVQPAPLGTEEIAARLGSGWIPPDVVRQFIREIIPQFDGQVKYVESLGVWKIEGSNYWTRYSIEATQTWGTARMNAIDLLDDGLNLRTPMIYDEIDEPAGTRRVLNDTETVAAQAKLAEIKMKFVEWLWSSESRARELCAIYNERYNCLRERRYDGSHLQLPGMNSSITLRPHQLDGIARILQSKATLLGHCVGAGKAQPLTAKILTPRGWKTMGEIRIGDEVIAGDGSVTKVKGVYPQGVKSIYRVTFSDGSSTECCKEHLWQTQTYREHENFRILKNKERFTGKVRTLEEIKGSLIALGRFKNHRIPLVGAVAFASQPVPLDPYLLGVIIGDGCCSTGVTISTSDQEVIEECRKGLPPLTEIKRIPSAKYDYSVNRVLRRGLGRHNPVRDALRDLGLYGKLSYDKFVPDVYKFNTPEIRLSVLRGLMDTDGTVEKRGKGVCFSTASERLVKDVIFLVQSLGGIATHTSKRSRYEYNGLIREGVRCHRVWVSMPPQINPFRLSRKASRVKPKTKYPPTRFITGVDYVGEKEARCIAVSHPDHLYVTDDFIVTHNTFLMVAAAMELKRLGLCHKTMAVVPNHLPAQWEAEARRLYPDINVLAPSKEELSASQRGELLSRISTGDWDLIIVPHTSFKMLPVAPDTIARYIQREIDVLREYLESIPKDERGDSRKTIKEIERAIKKLEVKLKDCESAILRDSKHTITWEELGVDGLFVDECFPYEARILTDQGELQIGEIVEKRLKVKALSCDTATGTMEWKPVIGWSAKRLGKRLVRVNHERGSFICTEDHKIWTVEAGYVKAIELKPGQTLRIVRRGTVAGAGEEEQGVLRPQVRGTGQIRHSLYHHRLSGMPEGIYPATTERNEKILLTELRPESVAEAGGDEGLRVVRRSVYKEGLEQQGQGAAVLWHRVCGEVATQQARGEGAIQETHGSVLRTAQRLQIAGSIGADEEEQPDERSRRGRKDAPKAGRAYLLVQGRQSDSDHTPGSARREARLTGGVCDFNGTRERSISVAASCLQSGYCGPGKNAGHRDRRQFTQAEEMEIPGPAQGVRLESSRVVSVEILERGSAGGPGRNSGKNRIVYDLEVADNHNFFADGVLVSNCHLYKNLYCPTKMRNVAGLPTADSQRAFDAFIKVRSLLDGGGRVVFATATPVSNTLAEVYVMMKFLQLDTLEEMGIAHFDAWTQLFAETSQGLEMKPDCSGFRVNTRFNKFTNLPELAALWRQVLDVKNADQLNLPRPRVAGGAPQVITIPASPELKRFVKNLAARVEAIKSRRVAPEADNMLKITTEGRKAALDIRLVMPDAPGPAYSKIEAVADKIAEFYKQSQHLRGAQAVFSDLGVPVRRR